ncbi:MAG: hypothetical protein AAGC45_00900 [Bacteroidota bacterium]
MNESLLLTSKVVEFRNTYPELIAQWESQIGCENCHPDLYFCMNLVDDFLKLRAYLAMLEYQIGFAINAHIIHSNWQRVFIESGHNYHLARELANHEIQLTYQSLNISEDIAEDPKVQVYHDILTE